MAEATTQVRTIREKTVNLTLSTDEAETLMAILAKVGGHRERSPRKHVEAVTVALSKAGLRPYHSASHPYSLLTVDSSMFFKEDRQKLDTSFNLSF
jgi:hypothetical protein